MDSAHLNIDILHLILDRSDQITVSHIMKTCHFLNREGAKYLLSALPTISSGSQALSFLQFMLPTRQSADSPHRLGCLDSLYLMLYSEEEVQIVARVLKPFFVDIAPQAPNFSFLEIDLAERFFAVDPELPASVASLKSLDTLTLDDAGEKTVMMLRALQSSLTKVEIHFDLDIGPSAPEDRDPLSYLHRSEDTLCRISLRSSVPSFAAGCYRNVRMLTLNYITVPNTRYFVQAFPNLECLRATDCKASHEQDPQAAVESQRALNIVQQIAHGSWRGLTSYEGSMLMLYVFALRCHVSHIYVRDDDDADIDPTSLRTVLADTSPLHLTMWIQGGEFFLMQAEDFVELSRSNEFVRLLSLRVEFKMWRSNWDANMEALINVIYDAIGPSPIPAVTLVVDVSSATTKPVAFSPQHGWRRPNNEPPSPSNVKLYLDTLDPETVAERLFTGNPSRRAVKVVFIRTWEEGPVIAHRGDPELIIDHDFDMDL